MDRRGRLVVFGPGITEIGGAAKQSRSLVTALAARGWSIVVIARAGTFSAFNLTRGPNLTVLEIPGFNHQVVGGLIYLTIAIPLGLVLALRATALISVQLYSPSTAAGLISLLIGKPFLSWPITSGSLSEVSHIDSTRTKTFRRRLLARVSWIVAQTPAAAQEMTALVASDRIAIVPNPSPVTAPTRLDGRPAAVYAGRFSEEKDLRRLVEAWREVVARHPAAHLTLVGGGGRFRSVEDDLRRLVAGDDSLAASITFTGWVEDVVSYLRACDVFVLPSLTEGMSNSLIEACVLRRIIVASDIAPNKAVLGEKYPLFFKVGDTASLVETIEAAFNDERRRAEAARIIDQRASDFEPDEVARRWEELILDAASRSRH